MRKHRGKLFASDAAAAVFAAFKTLDPALQHDLLDEVHVLLAIPPERRVDPKTREREAIRSLREAAREFGGPPSEKPYERARASHPESGWAPARSVKRWLGVRYWDEALRRAHLGGVAEGDRLEAELGPALTPEETLGGLRDCLDDLGHPPVWDEYLAWCHRPDVQDRPGRRPMSLYPFIRHFGSFADARVKSGLTDGAPGSALPAGLRIRSSHYRVPADHAVQSLQKVIDRLGRTPTVNEYIHDREKVYWETAQTGSPIALASYATIKKRFGTWENALAAIGTKPRELNTLHHGRRTVTDEMILAAIREAYQAKGEPFTQSAYSGYRTAEIEREPSRWEQLPSVPTIYQHFGSWTRPRDLVINCD
jgi:HNH endonuclease